jgi:hypothetical protein
MGLLKLLRRKQRFRTHAERRRFLFDHGRITDGRIIDYEITSAGEEIVFYVYTLNGVDFESSEILTPEQRTRPLSYAPGAKIAVRYDPQNQANSKLV